MTTTALEDRVLQYLKLQGNLGATVSQLSMALHADRDDVKVVVGDLYEHAKVWRKKKGLDSESTWVYSNKGN